MFICGFIDINPLMDIDTTLQNGKSVRQWDITPPLLLRRWCLTTYQTVRVQYKWLPVIFVLVADCQYHGKWLNHPVSSEWISSLADNIWLSLIMITGNWVNLLIVWTHGDEEPTAEVMN